MSLSTLLLRHHLNTSGINGMWFPIILASLVSHARDSTHAYSAAQIISAKLIVDHASSSAAVALCAVCALPF
jgi:hypothetical protein